jgi:hypothetical protein
LSTGFHRTKTGAGGLAPQIAAVVDFLRLVSFAALRDLVPPGDLGSNNKDNVEAERRYRDGAHHHQAEARRGIRQIFLGDNVRKMKFISLGFWAIAACVTLVSAASFSNPLKAVNGSDPHIVYDNGYYYLMTTTWTNLQITRARTLEGLKTGQNKVVWTDSNSARCCNVWAPELHKINNV